jgi:hypothetical protein
MTISILCPILRNTYPLPGKGLQKATQLTLLPRPFRGFFRKDFCQPGVQPLG